ncbi:MAG: metallophosphoesterase, partial [Pseudomonadales bacterium]
MATYAIGDIQGCDTEFAKLLEKIDFKPRLDRLWLLGDLINRGSDNLAVIRRVMSFGDSAVTVLGNHDLHFLAIHLGPHSTNRSDTFADVFEAKDVDQICDWYRQQPLLVYD